MSKEQSGMHPSFLGDWPEGVDFGDFKPDMQKQHGFSWTERKPRIPGWLAVLLCLTVVVPVMQAIGALVRSGDRRWLWHPWACIFSASGVISGAWIYFRRGKDMKLIHSLQPEQKLDDVQKLRDCDDK